MEEAYDQQYFQSRYSGRFNQFWWARRFYALIVRRYRKSGKLLEIGCGLGHMLARLEDNFETYGIDIAPYAVEHAKEVSPKSQFSLMPVERIGEFGPEAFDVIVALHVFEHVERPEEVASVCAAALRPRGLLVMATPNMASPWVKRKGQKWFGYQDPTHISMHRHETWFKMLDGAGFRIVRAFADGWWDVPYIPIIPAMLQLPFFGLPSIVQTVTGIPFIPVRFGESLIVAAEKGR